MTQRRRQLHVSSGGAARLRPILLCAIAAILGCQRPASPGPFLVEGELDTDFVLDTGDAGSRQLPTVLGGAAALLDADGDGDLDLWLAQGRWSQDPLQAAGDRFLRNELVERGRLGFVDATAEAAIAPRGPASGIAVGDYDADGDPDVARCGFARTELWRNDDGRFVEVAAAAGIGGAGWGVGASFLDYDGDGWLDLYVADYVLWHPKICVSPSGRPDFCGPLAWPPAPDHLYRNLGDGTFRDVTEEVGLHLAPSTGLAVLAIPRPASRAQAIYVANDQRPNQLWELGPDGRLVDRASELGVAANAEGQAQASMGIVGADVDGDGEEDLVVTHLEGQHNTFYRGNDGGWQDRSAALGLVAPSLPFTAFGLALLDLENDGDLDLFTANGEVRIIEAQAANGIRLPLRQRAQLLENRGTRLVEVEPTAEDPWAEARVGRSVASGDVDNDGDLDLVVLSIGEPPLLLLSTASENGSWLGLRVLARGPAGRAVEGVASRVTIESPATTVVRRSRADGSFAAASDPRLVVGLAGAETATVSVEFPSGATLRLPGLQAGRWHEIVEPER